MLTEFGFSGLACLVTSFFFAIMTCVLLQSIKLAQRLNCYIPETDVNRHTKITRRLQLTFIQEVSEVQSKNVKTTKNFMLP